jgi:dTDP-4-amino-4,6-dideoxygalactose transaminase
VVAVNTFGAPADCAALRRLGLPVVEDCAHGFGLAVDGGVMGARGDLAVLSLHATKLIGAGEGGAILTDRPGPAAVTRAWRDYVNEGPDGTRLNDKLSDIHAAIALCQLDRLDAMLSARAARARAYHARLAAVAARDGRVRLPDPAAPRVWYRYAIEVTDRPAGEVVSALRRLGIGADRPVCDWRTPAAPPAPVADRAYAHVVSVPIYPTLTDEEQTRVCDAVESVLGGRRP